MKGLEDFQKEYMVFVRGGKYKKKVFNLEVCKYPVTQSIWINIMGYNPSRFKGANKPVEIVNWWEVLKFCNKLSEKYNLKPVYDLSQEEKGVLKIIHLDGEIVEEDKSDFKNTEGFRLPTEVEWEWFARGGEVAIQDGTFDKKYSGSDNPEKVAWYEKNSDRKIHDVGTKNPNQLGLYDCSGNVWEWCYDTYIEKNLPNGLAYIYDRSQGKNNVARGGSWISDYCITSRKAVLFDYCVVCDMMFSGASEIHGNCGFRIVRTV